MDLLAYIQGQRKGKEAHRIEKEAMRDPFLADALEGFDGVKADHAERIARLRNRMPSATRSFGHRKIYMGIAASLLLCLMAGGYFMLHKKPDHLIAMSESHQQIIVEDEFIELPSQTETPPPPAPDYLVENEQATAAESAMRQRTTSSPASPIIVNDADVLEQAEIIVRVEEEDIIVAMDSEFVVDRVAEVKEADHAAVAVLGNARATENQPVATPSIRSDLAKEELSLPEPQIGRLVYEKYLKESMIPLQNEECSQTTGVVEVEFILKEGKPSAFTIIQSFCDAASKESIRLIEDGCLWIGEDGQKVVLKINF